MRTALATALVLVLLAATGATSPASAPSGRPDPAITDGSAAKALKRARERWAAARISSYGFEVRHSCFCPPQDFRKVVVVRGSPRNPASDIERVATVPRMFGVIRRAIEGKVAGLDVTYGTYGVPKSISLDPSAQIADEESYFTIRRFKRR
jgi:hypothetical protein